MKADVKQINHYLSANEIFAIKDIKTKEIYVPGWKTKILLQTMDGYGRDEYLKSLATNDGTANERLVIASVVDESGNRIFNESHIEELKKKSGWSVLFIVDHITKMNALLAGSVEEAEKN